MILLKLKGITQKGKNRIREHGELWSIEPIWEKSTPLGHMLLEAKNDGYLKWGPLPDFEIVEQLKGQSDGKYK